jgi:hypothetical protein
VSDALTVRIADGRTDLVFEGVARGMPATSRDAQGTPWIAWCAYYGDVGAIRMLLAHGEALASLGEDLGIHAAAFHGHWRLCEFVLEHGADANAALPDTAETPLHAALAHGGNAAHELCVTVLLARGADPNRPTRAGAPTGSFMRDARTRGETPLHRAAAFATADTIRALIDAGADRGARDAHGDTPLAWASWHRRPTEVLRPLLYGEHRIHPEHRGLAAHLLGRPHPPASR